MNLHNLYHDALSRIEKRERDALSKAVITVGHSVVPAPYRRIEIRAFYNMLKDGLRADYLAALKRWNA